MNTDELNRLRRKQSKRFMTQVEWENNQGSYLINNIDDPNKVLTNMVQRDKKILENTKKTANERYDIKSSAIRLGSLEN